MKRRAVLLSLSLTLGLPAQAQAPDLAPKAAALAGAPDPTPAALRLILVGDSTMATRTGYGDALCARVKPEVACVNLARGGRSSSSYRAEGLWEPVLALLRDGRAKQNLLLIQFGHNDQPGKPGRSTDLATEFPVNLARYVSEARALGAEVVLLTPLARRSFNAGQLHNDLEPWAEATRRVATEQGVPLLDLNALSAATVQAMGETQADTLAMAPKPEVEPPPGTKGTFDRTHLGEKGAQLFSEIVMQDLLRLKPRLQEF